MVYNIIAKTPASGPIPTTMTKIIAQIMLGRLLVRARNNRVGTNMNLGTKFLAAKDENNIAPINPKIVATKAILRVSNIPVYAFEQKNPISTLQFGGSDCASKINDHSGGHNSVFQNLTKFPKPPDKSPQSPLTRLFKMISEKNTKEIDISHTLLTFTDMIFTLPYLE